MWRDRCKDEDGVALVFALLAVIIVGGVAAVMIVRATSQNTATRVERDFEQAIHVAEAGLDAVIVHLNQDQSYLTGNPPSEPHVYTEDVSASEADQRAWAVGIAISDCTLVNAGEGQFCAIRPKLPDADGGEPLPWVYGVSFIPSQAAPDHEIRVIKMQFDEGFFSPPHAILTQGSLTLGGSLSIGGDNGSVHTNGSVTINGGAVSTTGPVTSSGSFSGGCSGCATGSGQVDDTIEVPDVSAIAVYRRSASAHASQFNATDGTYGGAWFDLCSNGTVQVPHFENKVPAPCTAATGNRILYDATDPAQPSRYRGWSWNPAQGAWSAGGGGNNNVASALMDGIYYVHNANADISGSVDADVRLTVIVDAHGDNDPAAPPDSTCTGGWAGNESGSLTITGVGGGSFRSFLEDLLFLTDRDTKTSGNMQGTTLGGVIATHEQLEIGGTPNVEGAVVAEDACDTPSSPVHANTVNGNFTINYTGLGSVPLSSIVRITAWNELS